jgi:hypothetical protein
MLGATVLPEFGRAAENIERMERERIARQKAAFEAAQAAGPPPPPPKPAAAVALEAARDRKRREAQRRYVQVLTAPALDAEALEELADALRKTPDDVAADVAALQQADTLARLAQERPEAQQTAEKAMRLRDKAAEAVERADARLREAKGQMELALHRLHRAEEAEKRLAALRRERADLFDESTKGEAAGLPT